MTYVEAETLIQDIRERHRILTKEESGIIGYIRIAKQNCSVINTSLAESLRRVHALAMDPQEVMADGSV